jgi:hypothetical protein
MKFNIEEFYKKQPGDFSFGYNGEKTMDTFCDSLYACPDTIPAHQPTKKIKNAMKRSVFCYLNVTQLCRLLYIK